MRVWSENGFGSIWPVTPCVIRSAAVQQLCHRGVQARLFPTSVAFGHRDEPCTKKACRAEYSATHGMAATNFPGGIRLRVSTVRFAHLVSRYSELPSNLNLIHPTVLGYATPWLSIAILSTDLLRITAWTPPILHRPKLRLRRSLQRIFPKATAAMSASRSGNLRKTRGCGLNEHETKWYKRNGGPCVRRSSLDLKI